jgi:hypothetical protein
MRAASYLAGTIIAVSLYLLVGAVAALSAAWLAAGAVIIALVASVAFVSRDEGATALA